MLGIFGIKRCYLVYETNSLVDTNICDKNDFMLYANMDEAYADANQRIAEYLNDGTFTIDPDFVGDDIRDNNDECVFYDGDCDDNTGYFCIAVQPLDLIGKKEKK